MRAASQEYRRWCEETKAIALPAATFAEEFKAISERVATAHAPGRHEDLLPRCEVVGQRSHVVSSGPRRPFCCQTTRNNGTQDEGTDMTAILMWAAIFALILMTSFGIPSIAVWRR